MVLLELRMWSLSPVDQPNFLVDYIEEIKDRLETVELVRTYFENYKLINNVI